MLPRGFFISCVISWLWCGGCYGQRPKRSYISSVLNEMPTVHSSFPEDHHALTTADLSACQAKKKGRTRLVISLPTYETPDYIINTVQNVLNFTENTTMVIVHVNMRATHVSFAAEEVLNALLPYVKECRFILNKYRMTVSQNHGSILASHMLNFAYMKDQRIEFDSFLLMSSNMRFYRCGIEPWVQMYESSVYPVIGQGCICHACWDSTFTDSEGFWRVFYNMPIHQAREVFGAQKDTFIAQFSYHEGFFAYASYFDAFHNFLASRLGYHYLLQTPYPAEEVWPATFMGMMNSTTLTPVPSKERACDTTNTCMMQLTEDHKRFVWNIELLEQLMKKPLPHQHFAIKRVVRNLSDPLVMRLTEMGAEAECSRIHTPVTVRRLQT